MKSSTFKLHSQLAQDTFEISDQENYYLGLHKNSLVPWFILVPKTTQEELFHCEYTFKKIIQETTDYIALHAQQQFKADKMNIATIGNIVSQLHIHIIVRKKDDFAWPNPVWGNPHSPKPYSLKEREEIIQTFQSLLQSFHQ